jgi:hypothetical protein
MRGGPVSDERGGAREEDRPQTAAGSGTPTAAAPRGKRSLLWAAVAAVLVVALVLIPGYLALQPGFVTRYPNLSVQYKTWSASTHKDVPCQACHVPPTLLSQAAYSARMLGEFYLSLVSPGRRLDVFAPPTNAACQKCHTTLVTKSPKGDLIIPHQAHVVVLKLQCVRCHAYLVHEDSPEGKHTPPMAACLKCHDGVQAKSACVTCHTAKDAPDSHKAADWLVVHAQRQQSVDCAACHGWTKNWCADCHSRRPPSHVADWRTTHPAAVKAHRDCEVCHTAAFCVKCHGDVPQLNFDPSIKLVTQ